MQGHPALQLKKAEIAGLLERICQALELSETQRQLAEERYESVAAWLSRADDLVLRDLTIYPQGSMALATTVKPVGRNEYDVDLVSFVPNLSADFSPSDLKRIVGRRLHDNGRYTDILEEKQRCWRLNYANEFHLDITPSIRNPVCALGGELVPDKHLAAWQRTNPRGYRALFEHRASLQPRLRTQMAAAEGWRAEVEPLPVHMQEKGVLRRTVQLAKRHRDMAFERLDLNLAPISVIITTLAARSYVECVQNYVYETELDLLRDVVRRMPRFIERRVIDAQTRWFIWNETTQGENFAEKWNTDPRRAEAFFAWQERMLSDLEGLDCAVGLDDMAIRLKDSFGSWPVSAAVSAFTEDVTRARTTGRLTIAPGVGLTVGASAGHIVRPNTFYGAK